MRNAAKIRRLAGLTEEHEHTIKSLLHDVDHEVQALAGVLAKEVAARIEDSAVFRVSFATAIKHALGAELKKIGYK